MQPQATTTRDRGHAVNNNRKQQQKKEPQLEQMSIPEGSAGDVARVDRDHVLGIVLHQSSNIRH
jgi:hypothetical protein